MTWWQSLCAGTLMAFLEASPLKENLKPKDISILRAIRDGLNSLIGPN